MLDTLLSLVAPHHCSGCTLTGTLLCDNCKYDIISESFSSCVACGKGLVGIRGICDSCTVPYQRAWCVGDRRDHLQRLIGNFKFTNTMAAYKPLADLLHQALPVLPETVKIVPIPTIASHIRQRGYDHMGLVSRRFGKLRGLNVDPALTRVTDTTQRGSGARQRTKQAKAAFACHQKLDDNAIYLLLDDVITSGATVKYAAQTLIDAGATTVWVASISRQPLESDKFPTA